MIFPILCIGQTNSENYVKATSYLQEVDEGQENNVLPSQKIESIIYYDGLRRTKQSIAVRAGGQNQNIVTHTEYDALGRTPKQYLPYATDTEIPNPLNFTNPSTLKTAIHQFYDTPKYEDTQNPYSEMVYENSPLNRVEEQAAPGNSWALSEQHTIKLDYLTNSTNEVRYFDVNFMGDNTLNPELILNGHYGIGQLYKNVTKDENWTSASGNNHTTEEFTNKLGHVVLKRTYNNNQAHDTYYVYDDYGNLTYVLSPEGSKNIVIGNVLISDPQDILNDLCYQYKYDSRNRLVEKKVPGKGWEYIVYNKLNQPILTQDANQRSQSPKEWIFTKYDAFGRVAYTGIKKSNISRASFQSVANSNNQQYEAISSNTTTIQGVQLYYTNGAIPSTFGSGDEILTVNYYDQYIDHNGISLPLQVFGQNLTSQTQGLPTVSKVRVLDTDHWITTVTGYDAKARVVYTESTNSYLNTVDIYRTLLDFTGNILESYTNHFKGDKSDPSAINITTYDYFTYDHQNRLLSHKQKVNNEPLQLIASNTYDELGQLLSKDVGGETTFDGYTDMVKVDIDQDGNIEKLPDNNNDNAWNAKLKTKGEIKANGGIRFTTPHNAFRFYRVGLVNTNSNNEDDTYFDYGIYIKAGDDNNDGFSDVNIILNSTSPITTYVGAYEAGDTFKIERRGAEILFKKNNTTFYTVSINDYDTYVAKASLFSHNAKIDELTLYGDHIDKRLQKVDYAYNVRGWLTDINPIGASDRSTNKLFRFHINYDNPVEGSAGIAGRAKPLYNGNISQTIWRSANTDTQKRTYGYKYDALNRIKRAYSYKGSSLEESDNYGIRDLTYDFNGNLQSLIRAGKHFNLDSALEMDNLSYNYDGNQLMTVTDSSSSGISHQGFYDGNTSGDDYSYDVNGNMIQDKNKGIDTIEYNHLNLPETVTINTIDAYGDAQEGTINYIYSATGIKLAKVVENDIQQSTISTFYAGGYIYENNNGYEQLKMFSHPEGYIEPVYDTTKAVTKFDKSTQTTSVSNYQYAFNYTDHLGNVRLTYADSDGDGAIKLSTEIISEKNFYPYGMVQRGYNDVLSGNVNHTANRFSFGGKELGDELGLNWYDIHARNYDPAMGRWFNLDPLSEFMFTQSPYNFAFNSPIYFIDLNGLSPTGSNHITGYYDDGNGNLVYDPNVNSQEELDQLGVDGASYLGDDYFDESTGTYYDEDGNIHCNRRKCGFGGIHFDPFRWLKNNLEGSAVDYIGSGFVIRGGAQNAIRSNNKSVFSDEDIDIPKGVIDALKGITAQYKGADDKSLIKTFQNGFKDTKEVVRIFEQGNDAVNGEGLYSNGSITSQNFTVGDTTSYILQYWKNGLPMGGSGAGIGAGRKGATEAAKKEMQGSDLDSIQVIKMYDN